jgi:SHAQKYF class myb-like DNA-binding protein
LLLRRWTPEEHRLFLEGIMLYGKDWKKMQPLIKTRSLVQIRTHAQKVFKKIGLKKAINVMPSGGVKRPRLNEVSPPLMGASGHLSSMIGRGQVAPGVTNGGGGGGGNNSNHVNMMNGGSRGPGGMHVHGYLSGAGNSSNNNSNNNNNGHHGSGDNLVRIIVSQLLLLSYPISPLLCTACFFLLSRSYT